MSTETARSSHDACGFLDDADYGKLVKRSAKSIFYLGARMRSWDAVEMLTQQATTDRLKYRDIVASLDVGDSAYIIDFQKLTPSQKSKLFAAALLASALEPHQEGFQESTRIMSLVFSELDRSRLDERMIFAASQVALLSGDREFALALHQTLRFARAQERSIQVDAMQPEDIAQCPVESRDTWWQAFNEPVMKHGYEAFELTVTPPPAGDLWFNAIHAPAVPPVSDLYFTQAGFATEPLVSIILPVWNPSATLRNSIESLIRQSWPYLEIIVVDDASTTGNDILAEVAAMDHRITVYRQAANQGAYVARNRGLHAARGDFITFQDADDISHSRRIERQLREFALNPDIAASRVLSQRVTDHLTVTYLGFLSQRTNLSTLMFRREEVLDRLGGFDPVRIAGDSEFVERLQTAFAPREIVDIPEVLTLVHLSQDSLSRSDFQLGWMAGRRSIYINQFRFWHEQESKKPLPDFCITPEKESPFFSPEQLTHATPRTLAVAILSDWYEDGESYFNLIPAIHELHQRYGEPVGLLHGVMPRSSLARRRKSFHPEITQLVEDGVAQLIEWESTRTIDQLIVADPELLMMLPPSTSQHLEVRKVVVAYEEEMWHEGKRCGFISPEFLSKKVWDLWRAHVAVMPASVEMARILAEVGRNMASKPAFDLLPAQQLRPGPSTQNLSSTDWPDDSASLRFGVLLTNYAPGSKKIAKYLLKLFANYELAQVNLYITSTRKAHNLGALLPESWRIHVVTKLDPADVVSENDGVLLDPFNTGPIWPRGFVQQARVREKLAVLPAGYKIELGEKAVYVERDL